MNTNIRIWLTWLISILPIAILSAAFPKCSIVFLLIWAGIGFIYGLVEIWRK